MKYNQFCLQHPSTSFNLFYLFYFFNFKHIPSSSSPRSGPRASFQAAGKMGHASEMTVTSSCVQHEVCILLLINYLYLLDWIIHIQLHDCTSFPWRSCNCDLRLCTDYHDWWVNSTHLKTSQVESPSSQENIKNCYDPLTHQRNNINNPKTRYTSVSS